MLTRALGVIFVVLLALGAVFKYHGRFNTAILFFGGCAAIGLLLVFRSIRRRY